MTLTFNNIAENVYKKVHYILDKLYVACNLRLSEQMYQYNVKKSVIYMVNMLYTSKRNKSFNL